MTSAARPNTAVPLSQSERAALHFFSNTIAMTSEEIRCVWELCVGICFSRLATHIGENPPPTESLTTHARLTRASSQRCLPLFPIPPYARLPVLPEVSTSSPSSISCKPNAVTPPRTALPSGLSSSARKSASVGF